MQSFYKQSNFLTNIRMHYCNNLENLFGLKLSLHERWICALEMIRYSSIFEDKAMKSNSS